MSPLVALLALQAGVVDPTKDPTYAKPITVEIAMQPLRVVVAAIAKASGKPVDVSGQIIDLKATVLVKDLPVGRTMEALADTLGLVWKSDGETLRLSRPDGDAAAVAAYEAVEQANARGPGGGMVETNVAQIPVSNGTPRFRGQRTGMPMQPAPAPTADGSRPVYARYNPYLLAVETAGGQPSSRLRPAVPTVGPKGVSPFAQAAIAWPSLPTTLDLVWSKPVGMVTIKSTWEGGQLPLSDLLVAWHAASGLPVVADAFRVPLQSPNILPSSALEGLQAIAARDKMSLKLADGVARMRHPAFWRLREQEIPESTWLTIERSRPTLGNLAAFAARLTPAQAASFHSEEAPLSHVPTAAIREAYPALLLWNTLSGDVQDALFAGRPVGLAQTPGSQSAYGYALREAPYWNAGDPTEMLRSNPAKVGFFGRASKDAFELSLANARDQGGVTYTIPL